MLWANIISPNLATDFFNIYLLFCFCFFFFLIFSLSLFVIFCYLTLIFFRKKNQDLDQLLNRSSGNLWNESLVRLFLRPFLLLYHPLLQFFHFRSFFSPLMHCFFLVKSDIVLNFLVGIVEVLSKKKSSDS